MSKQRIVIVGNGMVGHKFIDNVLNGESRDQYQLVTFSEEPRQAYDRVHLTEYFAGRSADDLLMAPVGYYEENGVEIHIDEKIVDIDLNAKEVISASGLRVAYDKLILATGSYPFVPPIPGHDKEHCLVYRTIEDLEAIKASAKDATSGVVVGGGLLGLEAAKALHDLEIQAHVVQFSDRLMDVQLDVGGGAMLKHKIEALGVQVHCSKNTINIADGENARYRMEFADGEVLETDMILFSAGIRPQDELAKKVGLELGPRGGITVNNQCQTSNEDIYAIGECALWNGQIFGLVAPGYQMAQVAHDHIVTTGETENAFTGADMSTKLKLMGVDVASIGDALGRTPGSHSYTYVDEPAEIYKRIVVSEDKSKLLGAVLVGEAEDYGTLLQYALNGIDLPEHPDSLILPSRDGAAPAGLGPDALPDTAQICSCYDVTKGDICCSVQNGAQTIGELKDATKAATGCGGCAALVTQVMNSELENLGVEVNTDICEHFPHTRQELFHIIKVEKIKTFYELLEKHGTGHGCDICKPTVGSILASVWNEHVMDSDIHPLQDTNDYYMANLQKDGTYSIVPRMAGGEVTPEKLIVLGQVAKDYNLYTKVTGGQRIDLFGARAEELPEIWRRLVDAGFETGHAYGKSLRTVKSCVGSTWCRYGVDDSAGLAVELENRYKGLRSPHKIKFGVSGCTRECAEAQGKDIGIIATESGWNLYVCGNGGMKPRHADLIASDLDKETLIKYIDRVLMFYVRTADRLQRTSVWFDNLEGGLDYLKSVVIDDKLDICGDLEADMQHVVDTYECEWKKAIDNPEKLKRFRHFVNSPEKDSNVVFVETRGQIRPATEEEKKIPVAEVV